jgi:hypothetical protein
MAAAKKSWKKRLLTVAIVILALIIVLILIASPLAKYLIEKYDVQYTGREITLGRAYVNPVTGNVSLNNMNIYEENNDSIFFHVKKLAVDLSLRKMISGTYQVSSLLIEEPEINIIQSDSIFNFSDLIKKFAVTKDTLKEKLHLNVLNIKLRDGTVNYHLKDIPLDYKINEINFSSTGKYWDRDSINGIFSLNPERASLSGDFMINTDSLDYHVALKLRNFSLNMAQQFIQKYAKNAVMSASLNMDLKARGNAKKPMDADASGRMEVDSFRLGPSPETVYASVKQMVLNFREMNPGKRKFHFDSLFIDKPYVLYQRFDTLDNFRRMFRSLLSSDTISTKVDTTNITARLLGSDYYVGLFEIKDADFEFNDYSIAEKFSMGFRPFTLRADTIDKHNKRVKIKIKSGIQPYGSFNATVSMNPRNSRYFDLTYNFKDMSASAFNPYIATYTSYQLDKGRIDMHGNWTVKDNILRALNHFVLINPRTTEKVKGKETKKVPLPLIMAFVKERGSGIDYEIPVTGRMNDPKFHLRDVVTDLLRNILVKPPSTPYRMQVRNVEESVEKTLTVKWRMRQILITEDQNAFLKRIAKFLEDNADAYLTIIPVYHEAKEKENILLFEAKKKYYLNSRGRNVTPLSKDDSMKVENMSSKDKKFLQYMDNSLKNPILLTLQEKCYKYIGKEIVDERFKQLQEDRNKAFMYFFKQNKTDRRIEILKPRNEIPFDWFSYFRIEYKGEVPEALKEAYQKLYQANSEPPRRKFFQFRNR